MSRPGGADYAGRTKYDEPGRAARYARRSRTRDAEEIDLVRRVLLGRGVPRSVLDVPCGTGRLSAHFLALGATVRSADLSPSMRAEAERRLAGRAGWLGAFAFDLDEDPPPRGWVSDLVVCFRFLHHLPGESARARVLSTLASLSSRDVLVSFHHPVSVHQAARAARRVLTRRRGDRYAVTARRLEAEARGHGLRRVRTCALGRYRRDLWATLFEKAGT
jgi:SAM-dependent methyltransferase